MMPDISGSLTVFIPIKLSYYFKLQNNITYKVRVSRSMMPDISGSLIVEYTIYLLISFIDSHFLLYLLYS